MHIDKYLKRLELEIDELIEDEAETMTWAGEQQLHVLLENCKHVKMLKEREMAHAAPVAIR